MIFRVCLLVCWYVVAGQADQLSKIVFTSHDSSGGGGTYIMNSDGSDRIRMYFPDPQVERLHPGFRKAWRKYNKQKYKNRGFMVAKDKSRLRPCRKITFLFWCSEFRHSPLKLRILDAKRKTYFSAEPKSLDGSSATQFHACLVT